MLLTLGPRVYAMSRTPTVMQAECLGACLVWQSGRYDIARLLECKDLRQAFPRPSPGRFFGLPTCPDSYDGPGGEGAPNSEGGLMLGLWSNVIPHTRPSPHLQPTKAKTPQADTRASGQKSIFGLSDRQIELGLQFGRGPMATYGVQQRFTFPLRCLVGLLGSGFLTLRIAQYVFIVSQNY